MSVVDDVRKVTQDFLAPELRGIHERLNAVEKNLDLLRSDMNEKFADVRSEMAKRSESLRSEYRAGVQQIVSVFQIERRLEWLEEQARQKQIPPKEQ